MLSAWSYSRLSVFEQCRLRAKLAFLDKIPEPPRPLPPGKLEHANDRGHRIHEGAELYVTSTGAVELLPELESFRPEFTRLREFATAGKVVTEGDWGFNRDWNPVDWRSADIWLRVKLDALVFVEPARAVVIDYKTGRRKGNEIKHAEQGQLYQLATFLRYPDLEHINVEFWYTDQDEISSVYFDRETGLRYFDRFTQRGNALTTCVDFAPNPNVYSCRYCPYGPKGSGHCTVGV